MEKLHGAYFRASGKGYSLLIYISLVNLGAGKPGLEIGAIVRRIKRFAVENDFIIFLLAHIKKNEGEDLSYRDLRDSSFIAQDSDTVIMIKRTPKEGINVAKARVEFHRRTGVMEWVVTLEKQHGYLRELVRDAE